MSYTLTVNIEIGGTRHTGSNGETTPSTAGHAWMSLKNNDTNETVNYGYTPVNSPTVYGDGKVIHFRKDAIQGAWDTIIVAPFKFGMSLGNLSRLTGVFDKQGNSDKSMNDVVRTALDKNDINFVAKRGYVKNIKIASNLDNFRSFKESHL